MNGDDRQERLPGRESLGSVAERFRARNEGPRAVENGAPVAEERHPAADASVVDRHSSFDGKFETAHDLRIEGTISGEITCRGVLYIAREAVAKVKVNAREIQVEGQLEGDVICDGKLVLAETAVVKGTVRTAVLVMLEGSVLNGSVTTGDSADSPPSRARARRSERETPSRDTDSVPQPTFALSRLAEPDEADV